MKKRALSFLLAAALLCTMLPQITLNADAAAGSYTGNRDWAWPVPSSNSISSCYLDIIGGHTNGHYAIDIPGAHYADIVASYPGKVIWVSSLCTEDYGKNMTVLVGSVEILEKLYT